VGGITLAWLTGETIIVWRSVSRDHHPPIPGQLVGSSAFFALTALLAEYPPARAAATLLAWGIVIAAYLQAPVITPGPQAPKTTGKQATKTQTAGAS
jgi:hypothetical protein